MGDIHVVILIIFVIVILPIIYLLLPYKLVWLIFLSRFHKRRRKETDVNEAPPLYDWDTVFSLASDVPKANTQSFLGSADAIPSSELIERYRRHGLDRIFGENGILYYTNDIDKLQLRNAIFKELLKNDAIYRDLFNFGKAMDNIFTLISDKSESKTDDLKQIYAAKQYVDAFSLLAVSEAFRDCSSEAARMLYTIVCEEIRRDEFLSLRKRLQKLPSEFLHVRSITVTINLDSGFQPVGAGIVSLNSKQLKRFDGDESALCDVCNLDGKDVFLLEDFNRAVLSSANKFIDQELNLLRTRVGKMLRQRLYEMKVFIDETMFTIRAAEVMREMKGYTEVCFVNDEEALPALELCSLTAEYRKMKLDYDAGALSELRSFDELQEEAKLTLYMGVGCFIKKA